MAGVARAVGREADAYAALEDKACGRRRAARGSADEDPREALLKYAKAAEGTGPPTRWPTGRVHA